MNEFAVMPLNDYRNICDAIREKTATTENIKSGDMPEKINEVYESGAMPIYYASELNGLWRDVIFPENTELTIKVKSVSSIEYSFMSSKNLKSVKLISDTPDTVISMNGAFRETYQLELVNLTEFNRKFSSINFCFYANSGALKTILGALDVSECTSFPTSTFQAYKLEDIEFVPNTICANIWFDRATKLTHDSLMSIIRGLRDYGGEFERTYSGSYFSYPPTDTGWWSWETKYEITSVDCGCVYFVGDDGGTWCISIADNSIASANIENSTHFIVNESGDITFFIPQKSFEAHTLTFGAANLEKLTDKEIAIATEKGWTLA